MNDEKFVLCINREYGSGGSAIGKILSGRLGLDYYDREILKITSETSAIGEQYFTLADEKAGSNILYKIFDNLKPSLGKPSVGYNITNRDNLFKFQAMIIKELALKESCIIVGRAADYILNDAGTKNVVSVFVHCDVKKRIERIVVQDNISSEEAEKKISKVDKERRDFYNYYAAREWTDLRHYDLCINMSHLETEGAADLIQSYLKIRGYIK